MNTHLRKHAIAYLMIFISVANIVRSDLSSLTTAQRAQMTSFDWVLLIIGFLVSGATVLVSYLSKPEDDSQDAPTPAAAAADPTSSSAAAPTSSPANMQTVQKILGISLIGAFILTAFSACSAFNTTQTSAAVQAIENPNNIAKAAQDVVQASATAFLAKNPSYAGDVTAAADAFTALASSNPSLITSADIAAVLSKTSIKASTQAQIVSYASSALGVFLSDFEANFPTLKPNYSIYLIAVANGLNVAQGRAAVPLPVIPWPPAPTPTPTPAPTPTPTVTPVTS